MVSQKEAKDLANYLARAINPVSIVMFGSVAKEGKGEDLDLLIVTEDKDKSLKELDAEVRRLLRPFYKDFAIDPFILPLTLVKEYFLKGSPFLRLIQREGRSLYMKDSVNQWLKQAKEDLSVAEYLIKGGYYRGACYHAQQAIEKALKASLIQKGWELEKTYSIERLIALAEEYKVSPGIAEDDAIFIDSIYRGRYPAEEGLIPIGEPSKEDALKAMRIASGSIRNLFPKR